MATTANDRRKMVVTYSSTTAGNVRLCTTHDDATMRSRYGLTSVAYGKHLGWCDVCDGEFPRSK